jgi:transcriptional regulator with XRE-family HTH domain
MQPRQCRMARAALDWTLNQLATASGVSRRTIIRFEQGHTVHPDKTKAVRRALESEGIEFIDGGRMAGGVIPPKDGT